MADSNSFNRPATVVAPIAEGLQPAKPVSTGRAPTPTPKALSPQQPSKSVPAGRSSTPKSNPSTAVSGVPRQSANGQRQLDGNRTAEMTKPVKKGGLAERQAAPTRSAQAGGSGMESAMASLADQLHPRGRPKITKKFR